MQCQLPVNTRPFPFVQLVNHLLRQRDYCALCGKIGLLAVIKDAAAFSLEPSRVERLRHARVSLLKGAGQRNADRVVKECLRHESRELRRGVVTGVGALVVNSLATSAELQARPIKGLGGEDVNCGTNAARGNVGPGGFVHFHA